MSDTQNNTILTIKQERFCVLYMELGNASEAYRQSYDVSPDCLITTIHDSASKLLAHPLVSQRLATMRRRAQRAANVTISSLTEELCDIQDLAIEEKMPAAAVSAVTVKAKLHGLLQSENPNLVVTVKRESDTDAARALAFLMAKALKDRSKETITINNERTEQ